MGSLISAFLKTVIFLIVFVIKMTVKGIIILINMSKLKIRKLKFQKNYNGNYSR